jgi:hypothetical protein
MHVCSVLKARNEIFDARSNCAVLEIVFEKKAGAVLRDVEVGMVCAVRSFIIIILNDLHPGDECSVC